MIDNLFLQHVNEFTAMVKAH